MLPVRAFHSRFIYGKPVETCRPYPRDYMKNAYEIVRFQYTIYLWTDKSFFIEIFG